MNQDQNLNQPAQEAEEDVTKNQTQLEDNQIDVQAQESTDQTEAGYFEDDKKETQKIVRQMNLAVKLGLGFSLVLLLVSVVAIYLTPAQIELYLTNQSQVSAVQVNSSDLANTSTFLENQHQETERIVSTFPTEQELIAFIDTFEIILDNASSQHQLEIKSLVTGPDTEPYVPLEIQLQSNPAQFNQLLITLEKLPYVLESREITAQRQPSENSDWNYQITARLYVSSDFK